MDRVIGILDTVSGFVADPAKATAKATASVGAAAVGGIFFTILFLILYGFLNAYGAASLSYCYNLSIGNDSGVAFFYSIMCFFFSPVYYPFYAIFLNPVCSAGRVAAAQTQYGGKKHARK
jgi:hypothetical protein